MADVVTKINEAIHACLEECYCAQLPVACMVTFLEALRSDPMWTDAEVHTVEQRVRQILTLIVEQPQNDRLSA